MLSTCRIVGWDNVPNFLSPEPEKENRPPNSSNIIAGGVNTPYSKKKARQEQLSQARKATVAHMEIEKERFVEDNSDIADRVKRLRRGEIDPLDV